MLLDDTLALYENAARDALAGLAERITSRDLGMQSPALGSSWLDVAIVEAETRGDPRQRAELTITTTVSVAVRNSATGEAQRLARWIDGVVLERLLFEPELADLYAKVETGQVNVVASDISGTMVVYCSRVVRSTWANYKIQRPAVIGLTAATDGGASENGTDTGRVLDRYAARMVSWSSPGVHVGPLVESIIYAGAAPGDEIGILDASGAIVATVPLATMPTGTANTPLLGAGEYTARLIDVSTDRPLVITERPG